MFEQFSENINFKESRYELWKDPFVAILDNYELSLRKLKKLLEIETGSRHLQSL